MYGTPLFLPAADQALVVEFGDAISPEINRKVHALRLAVERAGLAGVIDLVPSYRSLLVQYDPTLASAVELQDGIEALLRGLEGFASETPTKVIKIPVLYGGEHGPDINFVAAHNGLTAEEVVALHSGADYLVYMMGFNPGFPYLGGLAEQLATPRLPTPRVTVAAGSVGIAEDQTGVYPVSGPGGWRLIGRTPLLLFDVNRAPPFLVEAGDYIRFAPIPSEEAYREIEGMVSRGEYQVVTEAAP